MEVIKHDFRRKKVLVFGTGKSGIAAEDLLHKKGASVVLYDGNDKLEKEEILKKLESRDSVEVVLGELPEEMLDSLDLVVLARAFRRICRLSLK